MNPRLFSNTAFNQMKGLYRDVGNTVKSDVPLTYSLRNSKARAAYDNLPQDQRAGFEWGEGSFSKKRAAALAGSAYVGADAAYRTVSGGSAYRDSSGKKDIVGVPFI